MEITRASTRVSPRSKLFTPKLAYRPITLFARRATRDVELAGVEIKAGERVSMWYHSANRDEDVFVEPFTFDIGRRPNPHVAFGGGGHHYCLGANLAKREVHVMFQQIARAFPPRRSPAQPCFVPPTTSSPPAQITSPCG
jgi:cytochrome P450